MHTSIVWLKEVVVREAEHHHDGKTSQCTLGQKEVDMQ